MVHDASLPRPLMLHALARNWWLLLLRGIVAIIFGIVAFVVPAAALYTLVLLYGAFVLADGILAVVAAIWGEGRVGNTGSRWWLAVVGVIGIIAGIVTFLWPPVALVVLVLFIGWWSLFNGIFTIVGAVRLRKEIDDEWWLILTGALSVIFGLAVIVMPGAGALALIWVIGIYAILYGILLVAFSFRLKGHAHAPRS
ncbi:MAG: HdeD family acid-resistance protein [Hyphomicrobiales bacterium]